jgi:ABC-type dipeptide/oligopeptide/nickel transport system permease component
MTQYTIRRLLAAIPVVIGVLIVTFALARAIPGEPCTAMFGEKATPEVCAIFNAEKGLDKPLSTQFPLLAGDMLRGDFGRTPSASSGQSWRSSSSACHKRLSWASPQSLSPSASAFL